MTEAKYLTRSEASKLVYPLPKKGEKALVVHEWLHNDGNSRFRLQPITPMDEFDKAFSHYADSLVAFKVPLRYCEDFERGVMSMYPPDQMESEEEYMVFYFNPGLFASNSLSGARGYFFSWVYGTRDASLKGEFGVQLLLPNTPRGKQIFDEWASHRFGIKCFVKTYYLLKWFGEIEISRTKERSKEENSNG